MVYGVTHVGVYRSSHTSSLRKRLAATRLLGAPPSAVVQLARLFIATGLVLQVVAARPPLSVHAVRIGSTRCRVPRTGHLELQRDTELQSRLTKFAVQLRPWASV